MNTHSELHRASPLYPPFERRPTDAEIAAAALTALRRDCDVPPSVLLAGVHDGIVTLQGTTCWYYQRAAAARAVRFLAGVSDVVNQIAVRPPAETKDVKKRIKDALHHSVTVDTQRIIVDVANGTVTLKGTVRSAAEREDAARAALSAPGVLHVNNELVISG